jgi:hypothetical protein
VQHGAQHHSHLLFVFGHLAGASKSFGGSSGGYGGVEPEGAAQAQQTIEGAVQQALKGAQQAVTGDL